MVIVFACRHILVNFIITKSNSAEKKLICTVIAIIDNIIPIILL